MLVKLGLFFLVGVLIGAIIVMLVVEKYVRSAMVIGVSVSILAVVSLGLVLRFWGIGAFYAAAAGFSLFATIMRFTKLPRWMVDRAEKRYYRKHGLAYHTSTAVINSDGFWERPED